MDNLILQLCFDYLEDKDKAIAQKLKKKFKLESIQNGAPKLKEIISEHLKKSNFNKVTKNKEHGKKVFKENRENPKDKPICGRCKKPGHFSTDCNNKADKMETKCYNCLKTGHIASACNEKLSENRFSSFICRSCNEPGHISRNCTVKPLSCFKCNQVGHISKECKNPGDGNMSTDDRICHACKEVGHISKDCTKNPVICFKCNESGHIGRACPNKKTYIEQNSISCFKCGQEGHKQHQCQKTEVTSSNSIYASSSDSDDD